MINIAKYNAGVKRRAQRALDSIRALEAGDLALLKLVETGVNRSSLAKAHEIVMVKEKHANGRYTVVSKHGVVEGRFTLGDGLSHFDGNAEPGDLGFGTLDDAPTDCLTLSDLASLSNVREAIANGVGCKCRTLNGRKCTKARCPCAQAGVACSRACHKNGCCLNWTLAD